MITRKAAATAIRKAKQGERKPDRDEMEFLAKMVGRSQYKKALDYFQSMDTFVREGIPDDVVHFLRAKVGGGVREIIGHIRLKDCKKVFKEGFLPGVVAKVPLEFPQGITDDQLAMAMVQHNDEVLAKFVEVVYREGDSELCTIDTSRGF